MAKRTGSTKDILLEHSKAKANLYASYLETYINVLKYSFVEKIYIYDLMCGEGIYKNGEAGTSVKAFNVVKKNLQGFKNKKTIILCFNDNGYSDVEEGKMKIDRVREYCESQGPHPDCLKIHYTQKDLIKDIYKGLLDKISSLKENKARMLLLLDPYGYKDLPPNVVKEILTTKKNCVELLLFVPINQMGRMAKKAMEDEFPGGAPLKVYLNQLITNNQVKFEGGKGFSKTLISAYDKMFENEFYVNDFKLKTKDGNVYALLFFTPHIRGMEKFIEAKWKHDAKNGVGYDPAELKKAPEIFHKIHKEGYVDDLKDFILEKAGEATNYDLYLFAIKRSYMNKHTNEALKAIKHKYTLERFNRDNGEKIKHSYLDYKHHKMGKGDKIVTFKLTKKFKK